MGPTCVGNGVTLMGGTRGYALLGAGGGKTFAEGTRGRLLLGGPGGGVVVGAKKSARG